jgi:hypothetical protein
MTVFRRRKEPCGARTLRTCGAAISMLIQSDVDVGKKSSLISLEIVFGAASCGTRFEVDCALPRIALDWAL